MKSPTRPTLEKLEDRLVPSMTPAQQAIYDHVAQSHTAAVAALDAQEDTYQGELTAIVAQLENLQEQMSTLDAYDNVLAAVKDLDARIAALPEVTTPQWQTNSRTQLQGIEGIPLRPFVRFAPSPDGTQVLAIRDNGSVSIFDTRTGQQVRGLETGMTNATSIEWSPNGQSFAVSGKMGGAWKIQIHNATNGGVLLEKNFGSTGVADVEFSPDGTRVSVVMSTGTSAIYEVATGVEKMRTAVSSVGTYSAAYSKDGTELYADVHTSATSGYIAAYDTATGALKRKYEGMGGSITGISVSPDGKYLLAGSSNGQVNIYNAQTGVLVTAVSGTDSGRADSVQWNDAGNAFAVARSLTTSDKTGVKVYSFSNGSIQQVFSKQYPDGAETIKLRFLPGSHTLLIQETTWAYGESFYSSISAMAVPESVRPATRDALVQTRDALLNVLPDEKDTTQEIADARDDLLSGMTQLAESLQTTADDLAQAQAQEAAVDAFFSDYATQIATVLTGSVSIGATELMATAGAAEQADTAVLEAQDALWHALTGGADDAQLAEAADALAQSLSQRAAAYGTLTPATLTSPAPAGVDLLSLAGARGADALKSALLGGAGTLSHTVFTRSIAILSKTTEGPWDAKELWQARVSAVTGQNAVAAQTALDQLTASLTIRERNAAINQIVTRPLVRPSERQALLQTLTPQARQTAAEFQQAYRLSGLTSGSRNETGDMAIRFYSTALDINLEIRPNGDVYSHNERRVIVTLDPLFHSRPELLETLVPNDGLDALAAEHGYGVRETYAAGILVSQLGAVRMTLGSPNNDRVREGEFLNAQGVPVARVYVENGTGFVQYMNRTLLSGLSAAALADMDAFLAAGREATAMIASTGLLPERALLVPQSTIVQAAAFATQYGLELKGNSVYGNALGFGEDSAWSATLNTWIVWKDGKMMTEQELLNSMRNPSYQPQILATFNTTLGGMAMVVGARERLNDQDILASLPPQARMQMRMLTAESGAMLDLRQNNGATIATDILTQQSWAWDITSNSWRDLSASSAADFSASVTITERPLDWSPSFNRTFAESALSTLGLQLPSVRDFAIRMNANLFGRTQDDDLAALRRNAFLFTGEWSGQAYSARYQSLVQSRSDTMQRAQQQYTAEYDRLLNAIRAAYGSEEARRAGEQGSNAWMQTVPESLTTAAAIAEGVNNNFYRLYQTVLDLNQSTRALAAGADRVAIANAYDTRIIQQFEDSVRYLLEHPDSVGTPFSTRVARLIYNTDPGVLQKYFAGQSVVGSTLDTLMPNLQKTFVAVYSGEADLERRVAGIWGAEQVVMQNEDGGSDRTSAIHTQRIFEVLTFLEIEDQALRTQLSEFLGNDEIDAYLAEVRKDPQILIASDPSAFDRVTVASNNQITFGPSKTPQRFTVTVDLIKTSTAKNLLQRSTGDGGLVTNTTTINLVKEFLPKLKGLQEAEKRAMAQRAVSWTATMQRAGITATAALMGPLLGVGSLYLESSSSVVRATLASSTMEKFTILKNAGLLEYSAGNGSHPGKLIVINSGHLQEIPLSPDEPGISAAEKTKRQQAMAQYQKEVGAQQVYENFKNDGYEVIHFRVGLAYDPLGMNIGDFRTLAQNILIARMNNAGPFSGKVSVNEIGMYGYSWGGGQASKLIADLRARDYDLPIHLALVDAVGNGYSDFLWDSTAVTQRPDATTVFNRYQENGNSSLNSFALEALFRALIAKNTYSVASLDSLRQHLASPFTTGNPAHGQLLENRAGDDQKMVTWEDPRIAENQRVPVTHSDIDDDNVIDPVHTTMTLTEAAIDFLKSKL